MQIKTVPCKKLTTNLGGNGCNLVEQLLQRLDCVSDMSTKRQRFLKTHRENIAVACFFEGANTASK